jgi:hypothetical protein
LRAISQARFERAASAEFNGADPQARLADMLARINDHKIKDLAALLPWRWAADQQAKKSPPDRRAVRPHRK